MCTHYDTHCIRKVPDLQCCENGAVIGEQGMASGSASAAQSGAGKQGRYNWSSWGPELC